MANTEWALCPLCNNKTRIKLREDTELKKFYEFLKSGSRQTYRMTWDFPPTSSS